ncbi:MAG: aminotransferase class IV family protein [Chitinophagaceae bacterium]|nr:aminotransferase class IV family protein [Chitinophagaceae bacterium]
MNQFIYNGKYYKEGTAVVGADNRGLRYGDGIFETMKLLNGKLVLEDEHFARLWRGLSTLVFDIPRQWSPEKLAAEIRTLAIKNQQEKAARVRLQVIRGDGGLYDAKNHAPNYIIQTWALPEGNGGWNSNGLVLGIYEDARKSCDMLSNLKHNNYLPYIMAALQAKKEKWNDALLLNSAGRICDSTIANVFIVKNDTVLTPALAEGCVAGIMRNHIIRELKNTAWKPAETTLSIDDLLDADEVFLCNSIYNIRWVHGTSDVVYGNSVTQKIYAAILPTIG